MKYRTKPLLIKAGSDMLGLGKTLNPPLKDCRVLAEEYYQAMLKEKRLLLEACKLAQDELMKDNLNPLDISHYNRLSAVGCLQIVIEKVTDE